MAKIKFVRHYKRYNVDVFDVIYASNRLYCYYGIENVPKTVLRFIAGKEPRHQMDQFNGEELIYT